MTQAEFILAKLKRANVTQERLAETLGCRQSVIAGWKHRGFIPASQQAKVLAAARSIGVELSPADFFDVSGEAPPDTAPDGTRVEAMP